MIVAWLVAASSVVGQVPVAAPPPDPTILEDASHAIDSGRLKEAKLLIARAVSSGYGGTAVKRLSANLAFASGNYAEALSSYQSLIASPGKQPQDCEKGALSALKTDQLADAQPMVECAVAAPSASWEAWNARGVLADSRRDWSAADESYARARELAPEEAAIANNQGWSKLLRGDWSASVALFQEAATLDPQSRRIADNLELANAALAAKLPERRDGESVRDWAVRLNDAGVAAALVGNRERAIAAFTQAIDASPTWYERASNNLKSLSQN